VKCALTIAGRSSVAADLVLQLVSPCTRYNDPYIPGLPLGIAVNSHAYRCNSYRNIKPCDERARCTLV
jgi:hypothetical protein